MTKIGTEPTKLRHEATGLVDTYSTSVHEDRVERPRFYRVPHPPVMAWAPGRVRMAWTTFDQLEQTPASIANEPSCAQETDFKLHPLSVVPTLGSRNQELFGWPTPSEKVPTWFLPFFWPQRPAEARPQTPSVIPIVYMYVSIKGPLSSLLGWPVALREDARPYSRQYGDLPSRSINLQN